MDSIQDLTAKSWAAFGINAVNQDLDVNDGLLDAVDQHRDGDESRLLRARALDSTDLCERLRLAELFVLRQHRRVCSLLKALLRGRQGLRNGSSSSSSSREEGMDYYSNMDGEEGTHTQQHSVALLCACVCCSWYIMYFLLNA